MAAETAILYNGKRIIPAPELDFGKDFVRSADGSIIGSSHTVTLSGTLVGTKGWDFTGASPDFYTGSDYPSDSSGDAFSNLVRMQEKMRELFAIGQDYHWFEIVGCGGLVRKWRARVSSVSFPAGRWTHTSEYSIQLELQDAEAITDDSLQLEHSENWSAQFEEEEGGVYRLTHTLSASAQEFAEAFGNVHDGWKVAKTWLDARLAGADYTGASPTSIKNDVVFGATGLDLGDYTAYDYTVERSIDEFNGTYSISETWTLAKDPVFKTWTVTFNQVRDGDTTVSVEGEFRSFLNRVSDTETDPTNADAALTAFNTWDGANSAYTIANALYSGRGCGTLGDCAASRSVTTTTEKRGADDAYGPAVRTVQFSYEFSDAPFPANISLSKTLDYSLVHECETKVTISGSIQGYECGCDTSKLAQAQTAYATINCSDEASSIYDGDGTLVMVSRSYTENEREGTVEFSCEFTDKFEDGVIKDEEITIGWSCGDLGSDGESKTTYSVSGQIQAACDAEIPSAPTPASYGFDATLRRTSVTTDDRNKSVSYQYDWDDDTGLGLVEITVDTSIGPENCDVTETTVEFSVTGNGCDSATMIANARGALSGLNAVDYAPEGSCQTSIQTRENLTRGTISKTYTFSTECEATISVTITESYTTEDCGEAQYSIEGEIKGLCFATGGAFAAAEALYASHGVSDYSEYGSMVSSRVSRNERDATINFTYEFKESEDGYKHEQTISERHDEQGCCSEVVVAGTITPYCDAETGREGQILTGESAWSTIKTTLGGLADALCDDASRLSSTQVTRNKYNGQITYSYTYKCCDTILPGVFDESITISREYGCDVIAIIPILGRAKGPLIQDKGTKTAEKFSVSIQATFPKECGVLTEKPSGLTTEVEDIISGVSCSESAENTYRESDRESWNPATGRYTRDVTFVCEYC